LTAENKFKCPCHGSGFYKTGVNFEGPAPRPLERLRVTKAEDGQLVVDKAVAYLYEKGEWGKPGSFLKV
jgi:cytochrome b6-f complex iron-sulfur subunit